MTNNQLAEIKTFSEGQLQTIRDTLAKGATPEQFNLFIRTADAAGLNPMLNHIYCIVYGGKMSLQVSVEGIMYLAKRVEGYQGVDVQLVYENDEFKTKRVRDENGMFYWDVEHEGGAEDGRVIACYAFAYREGYPPAFELMKVSEVEHNKTGTNSALWKKYFNDMFKKHVVKRVAKRQFGIEISEESAPDNGLPEDGYESRPRKDITPNEEPLKQDKAPENEKKPAQEDQLRNTLKQKLEEIGVTTDEAIGQFIQTHQPKAKKPFSVQQLTALIAVADEFIEQKNSLEEDDLPQ